MSFQPFGSYVATDNQWFRRLPKHWRCFKLKRLIADVDSGTSVNASDEPAEQDEIGVLKTSSVYTGEFRASENKRVFREEYDRASCPLQINTLVVSRMNTPDLIGAAGLVRDAPENLFLPDRLWQVSFNDAVPAFMHYWTLTGNYRGQVKSVCTGTSASMKNLTQEQFGNLVVGVPPADEQKQIASFLDYETAKIDALIEKQQQLIALLGEKRQAVISHAVTKGLNPDAPMRDSGVEWLGEVPEHWTIRQLKRSIQSGTSISYGIVQPGEPPEEGVPFVQTTNISSGNFELDGLQKTTQVIASAYPRSRLAAGDVILGIRASIGAAHVVPDILSGCNLSRGIARIVTANDLDAEFFVWYLRSRTVANYWGLSSQGSTFSEVSIDTVKKLYLALPPLNEQREISEYINSQADRFNELIGKAVAQNELLQERRTALISAAVTGKIDVRRWKRPSADPKNETEMEVA